MLLKAASELVGGDKVLARHLGIEHTLLAKFIRGVLPLPDPLLLRTVDIILDNRHDRTGSTPAGNGAFGSLGAE